MNEKYEGIALMYKTYIKRPLDLVLSSAGIIVLSPLLIIIAGAIKIAAPAPDQYITKVGGFLRKTSLDELPQMFNIWKGEMSVIGPRPALWNQDNLYNERAKYGANDCKPGLTGWAQINGRDELEIDVKARLDGEYAQNISFPFDCKCFFGTISNVLKRDGVVEGGTGSMKTKKENSKK